MSWALLTLVKIWNVFVFFHLSWFLFVTTIWLRVMGAKKIFSHGRTINSFRHGRVISISNLGGACGSLWAACGQFGDNLGTAWVQDSLVTRQLRPLCQFWACWGEILSFVTNQYWITFRDSNSWKTWLTIYRLKYFRLIFQKFCSLSLININLHTTTLLLFTDMYHIQYIILTPSLFYPEIHELSIQLK